MQPPVGEKMRMKITDDDELSYLFGLIDIPVLYYINICFRVHESSTPGGFMNLLNAQHAVLQHNSTSGDDTYIVGNDESDENDSLDGNNLDICCGLWIQNKLGDHVSNESGKRNIHLPLFVLDVIKLVIIGLLVDSLFRPRLKMLVTSSQIQKNYGGLNGVACVMRLDTLD